MRLRFAFATPPIEIVCLPTCNHAEKHQQRSRTAKKGRRTNCISNRSSSLSSTVVILIPIDEALISNVPTSSELIVRLILSNWRGEYWSIERRIPRS